MRRFHPFYIAMNAVGILAILLGWILTDGWILTMGIVLLLVAIPGLLGLLPLSFDRSWYFGVPPETLQPSPKRDNGAQIDSPTGPWYTLHNDVEGDQ